MRRAYVPSCVVGVCVNSAPTSALTRVQALERYAPGGIEGLVSPAGEWPHLQHTGGKNRVGSALKVAQVSEGRHAKIRLTAAHLEHMHNGSK